MRTVDDILASGARIEIMLEALQEIIDGVPSPDAPTTVKESHAAEGTWSWLCCHGRDAESCWECL